MPTLRRLASHSTLNSPRSQWRTRLLHDMTVTRFPEWLRKQLLGTLRGQKAVSAKQRRESKPLEKELALAKRKKGLPMTPDEVRLADASEKNGKVELLRRFEADRKRFEARFR
jgi:hypothetical protein